MSLNPRRKFGAQVEAFGAAGSTSGINEGVVLAAVATMGYGNFLLGPPLVGFLAGATPLQLALWPVVFILVVAALSPSLRRRERGNDPA